MKKLFKVLLTSLAIVFFALALYITIFGAISRRNNDLLNFFGYSYAYVPTDSMAGNNEDSFNENSIIITKLNGYEDVKIGDIVVYDNGQRLIVHRIVEINENGMVAKGDNNNGVDTTLVTKDNFKGVVTSSFAFFSLGESLPEIQTIILFIMIVVLFIYMIIQVVGIIKTVRKSKLDLAYETKYNEIKAEVRKELVGEDYEK